MKRLLAVAVFWLVWVTPLLSQTQTTPAITAPSGAYNTSPQTCTAGRFCSLQTDVNGNLKIVSTSSPISVQEIGTASLGVSQIAITNSNAQILAARTGAAGTGRKSFCITNITGSSPIYISGTSPVTSANGFFIAATVGASACWDTQSAIFGISGGATQTTSYSETF